MITKYDKFINENKNDDLLKDISIEINLLLLNYTNDYIFLQKRNNEYLIKQKYCEDDSFNILNINAYFTVSNDIQVILNDFLPIEDEYNFSIHERYDLNGYNYNIKNLILDIKKRIDKYINDYYNNIIYALGFDEVGYILPYVAIFNEEDYLNLIEKIIVDNSELKLCSDRADVIHSVIIDIYEEEVYSKIKNKLYDRIKHYIDANNFDLL